MSLEGCEFRSEGLTVEGIGPFRLFDTVINGWSVPLLSMHRRSDQPGKVTFVTDRRFACDVPEEIAAHVALFIADAIAVAKGWSCHPRSPDWTPPEHLSGMGGATRMLPWRRMSGLTLGDSA